MCACAKQQNSMRNWRKPFNRRQFPTVVELNMLLMIIVANFEDPRDC